MSMGIGINTQNPDEGELKRDLEEIACGVWFTSTGAVMPNWSSIRMKKVCSIQSARSVC